MSEQLDRSIQILPTVAEILMAAKVTEEGPQNFSVNLKEGEVLIYLWQTYDWESDAEKVSRRAQSTSFLKGFSRKLDIKRFVRKGESADILRATLKGIEILIYYYPHSYKIECEVKRECFAVMPDGSRIALPKEETEETFA